MILSRLELSLIRSALVATHVASPNTVVPDLIEKIERELERKPIGSHEEESE